MLLENLLEANERVPTKIAVDDGARSFTYRQLTRLAAVLRRILIRETSNEKVGILLPSSAAFPAVLMGTLWAGKTAVPLNFLLAPEELASIVEDAGLDLILTIRHFSDLSQKLSVRSIFLEELPLKRNMVLSALTKLPAIPKQLPDSTAVLLYTSGTTATPKGVELTYANLQSNCEDGIHSIEIGQDEVFLNILPPFHVFGLTTVVLIPIVLGATVYAIPRFSPVAVLKALRSHEITALIAIPSMYAAILRTKSATPHMFRSVNLAFSGGEPLPERVRDGFNERFGVTLREGYGLTETSPVVSANSARHMRQATVGRAIRNVEVRIASTEGGEIQQGQVGEIFVRGPGVMKGYYKKTEETRKAIDEQGWFHTGDLGCVDDDGYLAITGRVKEMLIVGGENVYPREIEAALEAHDAVLQVAVIGMPDDLRGEVPAAFVIPQAGASVSEQELKMFAKNSVAGFKVPRRIIIREDLPQGPTGKILKRALAPLLQSAGA